MVGNAADALNNQPVTNNTGDTTGPTVQTVRITSNAGSDQTYAVDDLIEVTVTFDETVVVTGTPRLTLNVGGRSRTANYQDVTAAAVRFEYKVVSGDSAAVRGEPRCESPVQWHDPGRGSEQRCAEPRAGGG